MRGYGKLLGEEPSVRADVVTLSSAESAQLQSCLAPMSVLVSVLLQFRSAVLVADLLKGDKDACGDPVIPRMFLQTVVCAVTFDG